MILLGEKNAKIENHFMQNLYFSLFFSNFAPLLIMYYRRVMPVLRT
jgi:hypothetical protein